MNKLYTIILAGGKGSRMKSLTENKCKAMVKIGGSLHLIEFVLENCLKSGIIKNIGVIIQYNHNSLLNYLIKWGFNNYVNLDILPPKSSNESNTVEYVDTAHSVFVNKKTIDKSGCKDILILPCDHIYNMDYSELYKHHKKTGADLTVMVTQVSIDDASRFGIFSVEDNHVLTFEEKPKHPKSNLASTGVYIFKKNKLFSFIEKYNDKKNNKIDFGRDIIPLFLKKCNVQLYTLNKFWKDVGTIESFFKMNMFILDQDYNKYKMHIFSKSSQQKLPSFYGSNSIVKNSLVNNGNYIEGNLKHSILGNDNYIEYGANLINAVIMDSCIIKKNVTIKNAIISDNNVIEKDVGNDNEITLI